MRRIGLSTTFCFAVLICATAAAQGPSSLSKFNPFANRDQGSRTGSTTRISDQHPAKPKQKFRLSSLSGRGLPTMPKLQLPQWNGKPAAPRRRGPSKWTQFSTTTKNLLSKTKTTLMPWTAAENKRRTNGNAARIARRSNSKSSNPFSNLFKSEPAKQQPRSVHDFLSQPRPAMER